MADQPSIPSSSVLRGLSRFASAAEALIGRYDADPDCLAAWDWLRQTAGWRAHSVETTVNGGCDAEVELPPGGDVAPSMTPLAYLGRWQRARLRATARASLPADLAAIRTGAGWYSVLETFGAFQRGWAAAAVLCDSPISTDHRRSGDSHSDRER